MTSRDPLWFGSDIKKLIEDNRFWDDLGDFRNADFHLFETTDVLNAGSSLHCYFSVCKVSQ